MLKLAGSTLAAGVDHVVAAVALGRSRRSRSRSRAESLGHAERMQGLALLAERHRAERYTTAPEIFFGEAGAPGPWLRTPVRSMRRGQVVDVRWKSGYEPLADEPEVLDRWHAQTENEWGHARLWLHDDRPRPTAILIHGYLGGQYAVEERAWPVKWFFERLGLDLAIPVLPFHGPRNARRRPMFPASDPRLNVEGFRQAAWDLLTLRRALTKRGAPAVGVMGMSLGGYSTALALTADDQLAFGVPFIPLASIADFARDGGRLVGEPHEQSEQHEALERALSPVSPLARPARIDSHRIRVIAARSDKITPPSHARRLGEHFGAPVETFHGGHLLQLGRRDGFRSIRQLLRDLELTDA